MEHLKLLLLRHAQSLGNQQQRMLGHEEDELSEAGRVQAAKLAEQLQQEQWHPTHFYSSPLQRAAQTTQILHQAFPSAPVQYTDALKEFHPGILTGLTWAEAQTKYPDLCQTLENSPDWIPIPDAETLESGRDRAHQFIHALLSQHSNPDRLCIVTHSWILQHLIAVLLGCDRTWGIAAQHTARFEFWIERSRWQTTGPNRYNTELWRIHRFNDRRHLG